MLAYSGVDYMTGLSNSLRDRTKVRWFSRKNLFLSYFFSFPDRFNPALDRVKVQQSEQSGLNGHLCQFVYRRADL